MLPRMPAGRPYGAGPVFFCGFFGLWERGGLWGAAPTARQRRRSGRWPLKTARRAVWAAPYGLRFAATWIGKRWGWPAVACPCRVEGGFGWAQGVRVALGRSPGGAAAPPQRPQAAENRPQGGLGCALWLRFAAAGIGKYWRSGAAGMGIEMIRAKFF